MRALLCVSCLLLGASALAKPSEEDPETKWAAARVQQALLQREPIPWSKSGLVVPTAEVAIGIHTAVVRAAFGETALRDKPFVAVRSGDYWVVHGTLPPGTVGGTPITVIRAKDGAVLWVMSEA
jgi:NTF2 fold immunity protein